MVEVVIATGIAVMLVVAVIGELAARVRIGPQEMALLRAAQAAAAQQRLMASIRRGEVLAALISTLAVLGPVMAVHWIATMLQ